MTKAVQGMKMTQDEIDCNKVDSKIFYIGEQYFGINHLYNNAFWPGSRS